MEKRSWIIFSVILTLVVVFFVSVALKFPDLHQMLAGEGFEGDVEAVSLLDSGTQRTYAFGMEETDCSLMLEFPRDIDISDMEIESDFLDKSLIIRLPRLDKYFFEEHPVSLNDDRLIQDVFFTRTVDGSEIKVDFKDFSDYRADIAGQRLKLDFWGIHDLYDTIVVVDPGHGGSDPGNVVDGIEEKDINLAIARYLMEELDTADDRMGVFSTRNGDYYLSDEERVGFSNELGADLLIGIRQNSTSSGRKSDINGTEILYLYSDPGGRSKDLAERLLIGLTTGLRSNNRGLLAGDDQALLQKSTSVSAIAQIGYLSNDDEQKKLIDDEYQKKAAYAIAGVIRDFLAEENDE